MSLDIDVVFPESSRIAGKVDAVRETLLTDLMFRISEATSSKLQKRVGADLIELDLLADLPRDGHDNAVVKVYGETASLDLALLDGGHNLLPHIEEITINNQKGRWDHSKHNRYHPRCDWVSDAEGGSNQVSSE